MTQVLPAARPGNYRVRHVARAEIAKILTLRSSAITLGLTSVACLLVTGLVANAALHHGPGYYVGFDPTQLSLTGMIPVALTGGVFGALLVTGEYSSSTIRSTLAATPRRPLLVVTKTGVTAALAVVLCELLSFLSFFLGEAILSGGGAPSVSLGSPGALRAVIMTGLFIALMALMSFGFGLVFRSTAAAIAAFAGVVFVLPLVMHGISEHAVRYLPTNILTNSVMSTAHEAPGAIARGSGPLGPSLSAAVGLSLMALYAAIALAAGAVLFVRRDA